MSGRLAAPALVPREALLAWVRARTAFWAPGAAQHAFLIILGVSTLRDTPLRLTQRPLLMKLLIATEY